MKDVSLIDADVPLERCRAGLEIDYRAVGENLQTVVAGDLDPRPLVAHTDITDSLNNASSEIAEIEILWHRQRSPCGRAKGDFRRSYRRDRVHGRGRLFGSRRRLLSTQRHEQEWKND